MSKPYGPFTAQVGTIDTVITDQFPDTATIVVMNFSPYTLKVNPGTGNYYIIAPGVQDKIILSGQYSGRLDITGASDVTFTGNPPSVTFYVMGYRQGEQIPGVYPSALPGGIVQVSGPVATQVVNSGNAQGANVVLGTPLNQATELELNNDGSGFLAGGFINFNAAGKEFFTYNTDISHPYNFLELDDNAAVPHIWTIQVDSGTLRPIRFVDSTSGTTPLQLNGSSGGMGAGASVSMDSNNIQTDGIGDISAVSYRTITGKQEAGYCGMQVGNQLVGSSFGHGVNFKTVLTNLPTSITLTNIATTNANGINASTFRTTGFFLQGNAIAAGSVQIIQTYLTVGN